MFADARAHGRLNEFCFPRQNICWRPDFSWCVGRTDLPTGNELDEIKSINKVLSFPKNFNIYPGHGEKTMVGEELRLWGIE